MNQVSKMEKRLRDAVAATDLSPGKFAYKLGLPTLTVQRFVAGGGINLRTAQKLSDHFGFVLVPRSAVRADEE